MFLLPWVTLHKLFDFTGVIAAARKWCPEHLKEGQRLFADCFVGLALSWGDKAIDGKLLWARRDTAGEFDQARRQSLGTGPH